jgi:intracellular septation protein
MSETPQRAGHPLVRLLVELGPLVAFFIANARAGIFTATAVFMVAIVLSLLVSWRIERRLPTMPLVTAVFVLVFGGLTLILEDELFIKLKPTIVNALFAAILLGGLAAGRSLLEPLLGASLRLDPQGWRTLTLRWALFFVFLAALNEVVWRSVTTDGWVKFKVFGIMPLTILFTLTQLPLIQRHQLDEETT